MRNRSRVRVLCAALLLAVASAYAQKPQGTIAFTVSMEQPGAHVYHVAMRCDGLRGATQDFKMPAWSPGYYGIMDFAKHVQNFRAVDGSGNELQWEKSGNAWKVQTGKAPAVKVDYDVLATSTFVANPYLGEDRGYIVGTGVFMYVAGQVAHPVTVEIRLFPGWKSIATSLDPVSADKPHILFAPDFDVLYDSPILMGNLESLPSFTVKERPPLFHRPQAGKQFQS